jgi:hypothetical protein
MKEYGRIYLKVFFIVHLLFFILAVIAFRRADIRYLFIRIEIGALLISLIVSATFAMFRLEKGYSLINTIIGYIILIPGIFILRSVFGQYLFRFSWIIYFIIVCISIIYGIAVFMVSKKYKKEAQELNELLQKAEKNMTEDKD